MADFELRYRKGPGPLAKVLTSLGVGSLVTSLEDQEVDAADPRVVTWTPRSAVLRQRAAALVAAGRDDPDGARELAREAGRHIRELRRAAASVRQGGWAAEDEVSYRVDRLLVAAASGRDPDPVDEAQLAWFTRVRELVGLATTEGFALLSAEEPALAAFEGDVLRVVAAPGFDGWDDARRIDALAPAFDDRLPGIIERSPSRLLRTRAAWSVLTDHAYGLVGVDPLHDYAAPALLPEVVDPGPGRADP
jgi:hypothetical protein